MATTLAWQPHWHGYRIGMATTLAWLLQHKPSHHINFETVLNNLKQVEVLIKAFGLKDDPSRKKWRLGVKTVKGYEVNPATSVDENNTG